MFWLNRRERKGIGILLRSGCGPRIRFLSGVFLFLYLGLVVCGVASGTVLFVEKDGSAEYQTIQGAVDAAASGDTIRVGPGRYDDGQVVETQGWTGFVRVLIEKPDLTIIGSGAEQTIIGPEEIYDFEQGEQVGVEASPYFNNQKLTINNLGFEGLRNGVGGARRPILRFLGADSQKIILVCIL